MGNDDFRPVLRFAVMSDTHVGEPGDERCDRIRNIIPLAYGLSENDAFYKNLDAVVFIGDMTDEGREDQFKGFYDSATESLRESTRLIATVAKGHDCNTMGKVFLAYFREKTGLPDNFDTVINGFHFIGISTCGEEGVYYDDTQREFLKESLEKATVEDPQKPVFVFHHEHVKYTVYGSSKFDGWGNDYFTDILFDYPQIVDFSGHSHYPLNDPRSIWQGEITAIGTGSVHYAEFTVDDERRVHPDGYREMAQFLIVEADTDNNVRIRGYDGFSEALLCEYYIRNVSDVNARDYTPENIEARAKAPYFEADAKPSVSKGNGDIKITIPQAVSADGEIIFAYRLKSFSENGWELENLRIINKYWLGEPDKEIVFTLTDESAKKISITAENAFGMKSAPLETLI